MNKRIEKDAADPRLNGRVEVEMYIVRPSGYDDLVHADKDSWCVHVVNGYSWGWAVRQYPNSGAALNRKGEWVYELRGSRSNRFRRYSVDDALALALKYVDIQKRNGYTAAEASAEVASRVGLGYETADTRD